jgi:hypothetical protein
MDTTLSITSKEFAEEDLQNLTHRLYRTLNQHTEVGAALPEQPGEAGTKGDPITIGTIILTAMTSGAVVAFFDVLKSYFERSSSLEMEFQHGGKKLKIQAKDVEPAKFSQTKELAREFFGGV